MNRIKIGKVFFFEPTRSHYRVLRSIIGKDKYTMTIDNETDPRPLVHEKRFYRYTLDYSDWKWATEVAHAAAD